MSAYDPRGRCEELLAEVVVDEAEALRIAGQLEESATRASVVLTDSLVDFLLSFGAPTLPGDGFPLDLAAAFGGERLSDPGLFAPEGWASSRGMRENPCLYLRPFGLRTAALVGLPYLRTWSAPHEWIWVFHATSRRTGQIAFGPIGMSFWEAVLASRTRIVDALYHPNAQTRSDAASQLASLPADQASAVREQLRTSGGVS